MATIKAEKFRFGNDDYEFIPPLPTETDRGGIIADTKDNTYTNEVRVGKDGKPYTKSSSGLVLCDWTLTEGYVTYMVDIGEKYTKPVNIGSSPTTYIPEKPGYDFVGWKKDDAASDGNDILTNEVMASETLVLYAVFSRPITVKYYDTSNNTDEKQKLLYYNNGAITKPIFTFNQIGVDGWDERGWGDTTKANTSPKYSNDTYYEFDTDTSIYGLYMKTVKLSYDANGGSGSISDQEETAYYNGAGSISDSKYVLKAPFKLKQNTFTKTDYTFTGWDLGKADDTIELLENSTAKAQWAVVASKTVYAASHSYEPGNAVLNTSVSVHDKTHVTSITNPIKAGADDGTRSQTVKVTITINKGIFSSAVIKYRLYCFNQYEWDRWSEADVGPSYYCNKAYTGNWGTNETEHSITITDNSLSIRVYSETTSTEEGVAAAGTWGAVGITSIELIA